MKSDYSKTRELVELAIEKAQFGNRGIIIYPFGDIGLLAKNILQYAYNMDPAYLIDNKLSNYNPNICDSRIFATLDCTDYVVIIATLRMEIAEELYINVSNYFSKDNIVKYDFDGGWVFYKNFKTEIGKYSYGPLCRNHMYIEKIGAFCSFADGTDVVPNHEMRYISTHDFLYEGMQYPIGEIEYRNIPDSAHKFSERIQPHSDKILKRKRITIGNDVWLGRNVLIANYSNIGNGVIAGAGAVITKDVPDYAVVVGSPARIIRYRYDPDEIYALNKIRWWDWSDEIIAERYSDFYLSAKDFIHKYLR